MRQIIPNELLGEMITIKAELFNILKEEIVTNPLKDVRVKIFDDEHGSVLVITGAYIDPMTKTLALEVEGGNRIMVNDITPNNNSDFILNIREIVKLIEAIEQKEASKENAMEAIKAIMAKNKITAEELFDEI